MSAAQVTEAHKQLAATIVERAFRFAEGNHKITPLSQLIADSEAKACEQLRTELAAERGKVQTLERENVALKRENEIDYWPLA